MKRYAIDKKNEKMLEEIDGYKKWGWVTKRTMQKTNMKAFYYIVNEDSGNTFSCLILSGI